MALDFSPPRALSIAKKEFRHILRDPFTLSMALGLPLLLVIFFGVLLDFDIKHVRTVAVDQDRSASSRELLDLFSSSGHFLLQAPAPGRPWLQGIEEGRAKVVLFIPPDFSKSLATHTPTHVQVVVDGSDNQTTGILGSYLSGLQRAALRHFSEEVPPEGVDLRTRFLFNPELNSRWFVVTGLFAVVIGIVSVLLTFFSFFFV
jgi:ABC-2 type transport system permease protein